MNLEVAKQAENVRIRSVVVLSAGEGGGGGQKMITIVTGFRNTQDCEGTLY